jgi:hypothetical protein
VLEAPHNLLLQIATQDRGVDIMARGNFARMHDNGSVQVVAWSAVQWVASDEDEGVIWRLDQKRCSDRDGDSEA